MVRAALKDLPGAQNGDGWSKPHEVGGPRRLLRLDLHLAEVLRGKVRQVGKLEHSTPLSSAPAGAGKLSGEQRGIGTHGIPDASFLWVQVRQTRKQVSVLALRTAGAPLGASHPVAGGQQDLEVSGPGF